MRGDHTFETEAALCSAFIAGLPENWLAYPETAGWDILLVHRGGGWQIGVEAKLALNLRVLAQALSDRNRPHGPDFRAVLVPRLSQDAKEIANAIGITVIYPRALNNARYARQRFSAHPWERVGPHIPVFSPDLPKDEKLVTISDWWSDWPREEWYDHAPTNRHDLPDYVPEVAAGVPSPMILSDWKIKAIRVCVWVERREVITRAHFRALCIDPSRWMNGHWLKAGVKRGEWVAGRHFPANSYRHQHPKIYAAVEADFGTWAQKLEVVA